MVVDGNAPAPLPYVLGPALASITFVPASVPVSIQMLQSLRRNK